VRGMLYAAALLALVCAVSCAGVRGTAVGMVSVPAGTLRDEAEWQHDVTFPDWMEQASANTSANSVLTFACYRGQGVVYVTPHESCTSFSLYINNHKIDTSGIQGGETVAADISAYTRNGVNSLQVSDVMPEDLQDAVRVRIPYPVVLGGHAAAGAADAAVSAERRIAPQAFELIDRIVSADVAHGFTSAQLAVVQDGRLVYRNCWGQVQTYDETGEPVRAPQVTNDTLYDLSSVTKIFGVVYGAQYLVSRGLLKLDERVCDILGEEFASETVDITYPNKEKIPLEQNKAWKQTITVRNLLCHTAGFPGGPNYFSDRYDVSTGDFDSDNGNVLYSGADGSPETRANTLLQLFRTPLLYEPGTRLVYSDVDFMLLCYIIESVVQTDLDTFLRSVFWEPMGLRHITYNPLQHGFTADDCAATDPMGNTNAGLISFTGVRTGVIQGEVHDSKAWYCMGGISGHAGLFSNATDLAYLASVMLTGGWGQYRFFSRNTLDSFTAPQSFEFADYGLGWWRQGEYQTPRHFGTLCSSGAFGHQGFTGTLVFVEPAYNLVVVYLTNKIQTPMVPGGELMNQFLGGQYTSSVVGIVPQILLMGLGQSQEDGAGLHAAYKSLLGDMARKSLSIAAAKSGTPAAACYDAAYDAIRTVYERY